MRVLHVLRKPLSEGTVAANTLKHGTGGLNIDASRVAHGSDVDMNAVQRQQSAPAVDFGGSGLIGTEIPMYKPGGRWPANVILQHLDGCRCDGVKRVKGITGGTKPHRQAAPITAHGGFAEKQNRPYFNHTDKDGKETVANWICEPGCPVARLDEQSGERPSGGSATMSDCTDSLYEDGLGQRIITPYTDTGGASRFYKQVGGSE